MKHMQKMAEELVDCFLKRRTDPLQMSQTAGTAIDDLQDQSMAHPALAPAEPLARATASLDRELGLAADSRTPQASPDQGQSACCGTEQGIIHVLQATTLMGWLRCQPAGCSRIPAGLSFEIETARHEPALAKDVHRGQHRKSCRHWRHLHTTYHVCH